jgi:ABC-2 type transport system ATP-binding protein
VTDAVRTQALTRRFGELVALDQLTLAVEAGEIFGLVGPDGAGKTTTMRLLTGILEPSSGEAWVDGLHVVADAEPIKDRIGYMAQRFSLYPDLTVQENIDFYADLYEVPEEGRNERVERLLAFSNLTPFKRRQAGNLSGGMKQKLGLACALIHTPRVLFLDEPTNGVDPVSRRDFWRILYQLQQERVTIFVSTAYLDEAERCNRVGLLHQGRLLACDTVDGVKGLLKGALLEVRCDTPRQAVLRLRSAVLGSVTLFGDRIHILVEDADRGRTAVEKALQGAGIPCHELRVIEPTLEDVFTSAIPGGGQ